jgi:hypothetical protein
MPIKSGSIIIYLQHHTTKSKKVQGNKIWKLNETNGLIKQPFGVQLSKMKNENTQLYRKE